MSQTSSSSSQPRFRGFWFMFLHHVTTSIIFLTTHITSSQAFTTTDTFTTITTFTHTGTTKHTFLAPSSPSFHSRRAFHYFLLSSSLNNKNYDDDDDDELTSSPFPDDHPKQEKRKEYLATCIPGLAPYLKEELLLLGVSSTTILSNAAVSFIDDNDNHHHPLSLKALLWLRTPHKILEKIDTFYDLETREDVYDAIQHTSIPIQSLLGDGQGGLLSLNVKVINNGGRRIPQDISHSHYTALTIKNALVDLVRDLKDGERPNVDLDDPDVPLVAILHSSQDNNFDGGSTADMTLYRSISPPTSLHKRGYRSGGAIHKAGKINIFYSFALCPLLLLLLKERM